MKNNIRVYNYVIYSFYGQMKNRILISLLVLLTVIGVQFVNNIWFEQALVNIYAGVSFEEAKEGVFTFPVIWLFVQILPFYMLGNSFSWNIAKADINVIGRLKQVSKNYLWLVKFSVIVTFCMGYSVLMFLVMNVIELGKLFNAYGVEKITAMMLVLIFMVTIFCWLDYYFSSSIAFLVIAIFYGVTVYIKTPYFFLSVAMGSRYDIYYAELGSFLILIEVVLLIISYFYGKWMYRKVEY
ncbi:hypothetical protein HCA69_04605 [Listeria grandensis]|uniref:ABC transporter permease n=1 Tax=Listeria grandensis TaxID=1494963 RepID=A0A7X1CP44_9LIST|nr:hypothetical protein [Listeria grandensis]MBC1935635.1 hypothetical protein [Listeria grandensis]